GEAPVITADDDRLWQEDRRIGVSRLRVSRLRPTAQGDTLFTGDVAGKWRDDGIVRTLDEFLARPLGSQHEGFGDHDALLHPPKLRTRRRLRQNYGAPSHGRGSIGWPSLKMAKKRPSPFGSASVPARPSCWPAVIMSPCWA